MSEQIIPSQRVKGEKITIGFEYNGRSTFEHFCEDEYLLLTGIDSDLYDVHSMSCHLAQPSQ